MTNINRLFEKRFAAVQIKAPADKKKVVHKGKLPPAIVMHGKFGEDLSINGSAYKSLQKKSDASGIDIGTLVEVYIRGYKAAIYESSYVGKEPQQVAFDRVNSFINQGRSYFEEDSDLVYDVKEEMREAAETNREINTGGDIKFKGAGFEGPYAETRRSDGSRIPGSRMWTGKHKGAHDQAVNHLKSLGFKQHNDDAVGHSDSRGNYRISYLHHPNTKSTATVTTEHGEPVRASIFHDTKRGLDESVAIDEISTDLLHRAADAARSKSNDEIRNKNFSKSIKHAHRASKFERASLSKHWEETERQEPIEETIEYVPRNASTPRKQIDNVGRKDSKPGIEGKHASIIRKIVETVKSSDKHPVVIPAHLAQPDPSKPPITIPAKTVMKRVNKVIVNPNDNPNDGK